MLPLLTRKVVAHQAGAIPATGSADRATLERKVNILLNAFLARFMSGVQLEAFDDESDLQKHIEGSLRTSRNRDRQMVNGINLTSFSDDELNTTRQLLHSIILIQAADHERIRQEQKIEHLHVTLFDETEIKDMPSLRNALRILLNFSTSKKERKDLYDHVCASSGPNTLNVMTRSFLEDILQPAENGFFENVVQWIEEANDHPFDVG